MKLRDDVRTRWNNPPYIEQYKCTLNIGYHADLLAIIGIADRQSCNGYEFNAMYSNSLTMNIKTSYIYI